MSKSGGFLQILTHDNYKQTNGIQVDFFYTSPMLEILQQTEVLSRHKLYQRPYFWVQKLKKQN